jgi:hypothetical protein
MKVLRSRSSTTKSICRSQRHMPSMYIDLLYSLIALQYNKPKRKKKENTSHASRNSSSKLLLLG